MAVYPFTLSLLWRGSFDLDVSGLRGYHVTGVISLRGESIAGRGFIFVHRHSCKTVYPCTLVHHQRLPWRGSCDLDQTGCREDHVMCLSIVGRVLFSHVLLYTQAFPQCHLNIILEGIM